jgi:hypothetical protein
MTCSIVIDPSALWLLDGTEAGEEEASSYINAATAWMSGPVRAGFTVLVSDRAVQRLADAGVFPAERHIKAVLETAGLASVLSAKQLAASISKFLSTAPRVEDEWEISDVLTDTEVIDPDFFRTIGDTELKGISILNLCLYCAHLAAGFGSNRRMLYAHPRLEQGAQTANVTFTLLDADCHELVVPMPHSAVEAAHAAKLPANIDELMDAAQVWTSATCEADLHFAISLAARGIVRQTGGLPPRTFRIGSSFLTSLQRHGGVGGGEFAKTTLSKCAQVVARSDNLEVRDFRDGAASTSPTRCRARDGARARRVHVTDSHEALRLMFWELDNSNIEFANIGTKFELLIEVGIPA